MVRSLVAWALLASPLTALAQGGGFREVFDRAVEDFRMGRIEESAVGFDKLVSLVPDSLPQLWQRGIVLYYAERFDDCRIQFESHRTVNPNDVENAAWHFLCVAKTEGSDTARGSLLPVGPDSRVPMQQIYRLFSGTATSEEVMAEATGKLSSEFYAHLYIGLHAEAVGHDVVALNHIRAAARDEYAEVGGYMHMVARAHLHARGER